MLEAIFFGVAQALGRTSLEADPKNTRAGMAY
jgi:hypothetical protein